MSQKPSYFRIGLFAVVALAILAGGLIAFGAGQMFRPRVYIETYVNGTVQGVDVGSPVKFRGVPIGRVSAINFTFNEYGAASQVDRFNYVFILMEVDRQMFPGMFDENLTPVIEKNVAEGLRALLLHPLRARPAHQHARFDQHYHASGRGSQYRRDDQLADRLARQPQQGRHRS